MVRNNEKISIPLHCVGGHTALPSEQGKPRRKSCFCYSVDQSLSSQANANANNVGVNAVANPIKVIMSKTKRVYYFTELSTIRRKLVKWNWQQLYKEFAL